MPKKRHILFLSSWYPSRVLPVNGDFIQRHAEAVSLKHHVTVIHVITDNNAKTNIEVEEQKTNGVRTLIAYLKPSKAKIFYFIKAYFLLIKKVKTIDLIHVNKLYPVGLIAVVYYLFKRKNYLISEHHHQYYTPFNNNIGYIEKVLSKLIVKKASFVCPVSDDLGIAMQNFGLRGNYNKVSNVVFTDVFKPKHLSNNKRFTLLHISSMDKVKNVKGILQAISHLQEHIDDFVFYLIGEGASDYKDYSDSLKINRNNIVFIDQIPQNELVNYYQKADVFLLFSNIETFSIVVYEAFSSGTPVIVSDLGAIRENFPKDFGILVEKKNTDQLFKAILKVYSGAVKAKPDEMHAYVEKNFSRQAIADEFSKLYEKILAI